MRRKDLAITHDAALTLLREAEWGVLSTVSESGEPYGVPLNFCLLDDAVYIHCAVEGRMIDCIAHKGEVSFCVVGDMRVLADRFTTQYESVIVSGRAEEVQGEEKRSGLLAFVEKYSPDYRDEGRAIIERLFDKTRVFRIVIEAVTGKASSTD